MLWFAKLSAASAGRLIRAYFTENSPDRAAGEELKPDSSGRLTAYYTGRDSRATWRADMPFAVSRALGIDPTRPPTNEALDRLFEAKRADSGEKWSKGRRAISAFDFQTAPHKSVTLAAEFGQPAESAALYHAMDRANDATMRLLARDLGWARRGNGGQDGAERGAVGWVTFRHFTARRTHTVQDGPDGITYLAEVPVPGDPHAHNHNAFFNLVVTDDGHVGSLDTKRLTKAYIYTAGAYYQAVLGDELRKLGARTGYDATEKAIVLLAIPNEANEFFSKGHKSVVTKAKKLAKRQGLDWNELSADRKYGLLAATAVKARLSKGDAKTDREIWLEGAKALGWEHDTVMEGHSYEALTDAERYDRAYAFAARHIAEEFRTAAQIDHDKLAMYAARGLIGTGIKGPHDIDEVVKLIEERGIDIAGERVALVVGLVDDKVRVANTRQVRMEHRLAELARAAALDTSRALTPATIQAAIETSGIRFAGEEGADQRSATYALGTGGRLSFVQGPAGSGKTTLLTPLVSAYRADGRDVIGISTAWRQADALKDAGIEQTYALEPFFHAVESGAVRVTRDTVLVVDEFSQIGVEPALRLLELQAETGCTIKGLVGREQCQAIQAGDSVETMARVLPREALFELKTSVRQATKRGREIADLFRQGNAEAALKLKRADGTARLVGGDYDQVVERIAEHYMQRRDVLLAAGSKRGITISALTNEDAAAISFAVRERLKARGEIGIDEVTYRAIDQRGETYDLAVATGDKVRLFRKTRIDRSRASIGNNGDVVEILGRDDAGLTLCNRDGDIGHVAWSQLTDSRTGRLLLGHGHCLTVDAAQGITSDEHINALPRGTAGATAFKSYTAESRHVHACYTMIAEAAVFEAVRQKRPLGDQEPITSQDLWERVAEDMSDQPWKSLAIDLLDALQRDHDHAVDSFIRSDQRIQAQQLQGRDHAREVHARRQDEAARRHLSGQIVALDNAILANALAMGELAQNVTQHLGVLRAGMVMAQRRVEQTRGAAPRF